MFRDGVAIKFSFYFIRNIQNINNEGKTENVQTSQTKINKRGEKTCCDRAIKMKYSPNRNVQER